MIHQAQTDVIGNGSLIVSAQVIRSGSTDFTRPVNIYVACSRPRRVLTSLPLGSQLTAAGWQLTKRCRKQDKVSVLLHLEGFPILPHILADLGLEKLVPVAAASEGTVRANRIGGQVSVNSSDRGRESRKRDNAASNMDSPMGAGCYPPAPICGGHG